MKRKNSTSQESLAKRLGTQSSGDQRSENSIVNQPSTSSNDMQGGIRFKIKSYYSNDNISKEDILAIHPKCQKMIDQCIYFLSHNVFNCNNKDDNVIHALNTLILQTSGYIAKKDHAILMQEYNTTILKFIIYSLLDNFLASNQENIKKDSFIQRFELEHELKSHEFFRKDICSLFCDYMNSLFELLSNETNLDVLLKKNLECFNTFEPSQDKYKNLNMPFDNKKMLNLFLQDIRGIFLRFNILTEGFRFSNYNNIYSASNDLMDILNNNELSSEEKIASFISTASSFSGDFKRNRMSPEKAGVIINVTHLVIDKLNTMGCLKIEDLKTLRVLNAIKTKPFEIVTFNRLYSWYIHTFCNLLEKCDVEQANNKALKHFSDYVICKIIGGNNDGDINNTTNFGHKSNTIYFIDYICNDAKNSLISPCPRDGESNNSYEHSDTDYGNNIASSSSNVAGNALENREHIDSVNSISSVVSGLLPSENVQNIDVNRSNSMDVYAHASQDHNLGYSDVANSDNNNDIIKHPTGCPIDSASPSSSQRSSVLDSSRNNAVNNSVFHTWESGSKHGQDRCVNDSSSRCCEIHDQERYNDNQDDRTSLLSRDGVLEVDVETSDGSLRRGVIPTSSVITNPNVSNEPLDLTQPQIEALDLTQPQIEALDLTQPQIEALDLTVKSRYK